MMRFFLVVLVFGGSVVASTSALSVQEPLTQISPSHGVKPKFSGEYVHDYSKLDLLYHTILHTRFDFNKVDKIIAEISENGLDAYHMPTALDKAFARNLVSKCTPSQFKQLIELKVVDISDASTYAKFLVEDESKQDEVIEKFMLLKEHGVDLNSIRGKMNVNGVIQYIGPMDHAARLGFVNLLTYLSSESVEINSLEIAWSGIFIWQQNSYLDIAKTLIEVGYPPDETVLPFIQRFLKQKHQELDPALITLLQPYLNKNHLVL